MDVAINSQPHRPGVSPEMHSLILIARLASGNEATNVATAKIERLADSTDWGGLSECAARHGMTPFLNRLLASSEFSGAPREMAQAARESISSLVRHNLLATADLIEILSEFEKSDIFAIPIKGPALAWLLYRDLSLREFSDLDLLIDGTDLGKASKVLIAMGYEPELELSPSREKIFVMTENVLLFTHAATGRLVEIHWELSPRYLAPPIDIEVFRSRLTTVEPGSKIIKTMSEEDTLIYLCAHGAKHHWEKLNWVTDVATLVNRAPGMDWIYIFDQAARRKSDRMLMLGLYIARDLLGARLPNPAIDFFEREPIIYRLGDEVRDWLLRDSIAAPGWLWRWKFYSRLQSGLSNKLRFAYLSLAAPNTVDWQSVDLPDSLAPLYIFARPLRLLTGLTRRR